MRTDITNMANNLKSKELLSKAQVLEMVGKAQDARRDLDVLKTVRRYYESRLIGMTVLHLPVSSFRKYGGAIVMVAEGFLYLPLKCLDVELGVWYDLDSACILRSSFAEFLHQDYMRPIADLVGNLFEMEYLVRCWDTQEKTPGDEMKDFVIDYTTVEFSDLLSQDDVLKAVAKAQEEGPWHGVLAELEQEYWEDFGHMLILNIPFSENAPIGGAIVPVKEGFLMLPCIYFGAEEGVVYDYKRAALLDQASMEPIKEAGIASSLAVLEYMDQMFKLVKGTECVFASEQERDDEYLSRPLLRGSCCAINEGCIHVYGGYMPTAYFVRQEETTKQEFTDLVGKVTRLAKEKGIPLKTSWNSAEILHNWTFYQRQQDRLRSYYPRVRELAEMVQQRGIHIGAQDDVILNKLTGLIREYNELKMTDEKFSHFVQCKHALNLSVFSMESNKITNKEAIHK